MLHVASIPPIAIAAIVSYVGAYFFLVWTRARRARENLTFALTCFGVAVYAIGCAGLYNTDSPVDGRSWQRMQRVAVALDAVAFLWFIADYTKRLPRRWLWFLSAFAIVISGVLVVAPGLILSDEPAVKMAHLPWGATVTYNEVAISPRGYLLEVLGAAVFSLAMIAAIRQYRSGERGRAVPLIAAVSILWAGVLNDTAIALRFYSFVYTIEYSFLALVVMMSYRLSAEHRRVGEMEAALRASEHRYRSLVEGIDDLVLQIDRRGVVDFANRGAADAFAVPREELVGRSIFEMVPAERSARLQQAFENWLAGETPPTDIELSHLTDSGRTVHVLWRVTPAVDESGRSQRINAIGRDITERRRVEEQVAARFQRLERQQAAILSLAVDQTIVSGDFSRAAQRVAETAAETLSVERVGVWRSQDDGRRFSCLALFERTPHRFSSGMTVALNGTGYAETIRSERVLAVGNASSDVRLTALRENRLLPEGVGAMLDAPLRVGGRLEGRLCIEHMGGSRDWSEDEIVFAGELADQMAQAVLNAERRQAEAERLLLSTAISQAAEAVIISDLKGGIRYVNPAFERITGYPRDEVIGRTAALLRSAADDDAFFDSLRATLRSGRTWKGRMTNRRRDGSLFVQETIISPVRDGSGAIANFVGVGRDVSAEVEMEERLRQAQKMEAVGQLAGGVAHDFNNLLTPLLGVAEILLADLKDNDPVRASVLEIRQAGERARDLTRRLLAFGRKQVIEMRPLDLGDLVRCLARILERTIREDVEIVLRLAPSLGLVRADASQLEQVLMNLAVNAQDAMPSGGRLEIEAADTRLDEKTANRPADLQPGPYVTLIVRDTGIGMDESVRRHLFEPFFTTKEQGRGTGLGLATSYGIVKQHGGDISVDSQVGHGTVFTIYLPRAEAELEKTESGVGPSPPLRRGAETIVVAEDDAMVRKLVCTVLQNQGYEVLAASSGADCIRQVEQRTGPIDLLFTDVIMPGMNGRDLYRRLLALRPGLRVLFASGHPENIIAPRGVLEEGVAFLHKPFSMQALVRRVRELLDVPASPEDPPRAN